MRNPKKHRSPKRPANTSGFLSQTAHYALRVVAELARRGEQTPVRATDLSQQTGVPTHYLSKVLRRLVEHGVLQSQRGHGGGFVLARSASETTVADVLSAVGAVPKGGCVFGWAACSEVTPCPLHHTWSALQMSFGSWAEHATFAPPSDGEAVLDS